MTLYYALLQKKADIEWKFARTWLKMTYFAEMGSLPPPFNLLMIPQIFNFIIGYSAKCSICCRKWKKIMQIDMDKNAVRAYEVIEQLNVFKLELKL